MTEPADLILRNAEVHTLADPDGDGTPDAEAVAVRDGEIVRVDTDYEVDFLEGVETEVVDLAGRTLLPGFVDAHTHMDNLGQYTVHADLSGAASLDEALERLRENVHEDREWVLGFGYDESEWGDDADYPTRADLDEVSEERPVAALRVDLHTASLNSVALDLLGDDLPDTDVRTEGGEPTGVVVEDAAETVRETIAPDREQTRDLLLAARDVAHERGVTGVHDMVRDSHAPAVYRDLAEDGDLDLRVRINYWSDHLDALQEVGLETNHGGELVETGAIKTFTDGSFGSRTAKLSEPYADAPEETGQWVVDPDELDDLVERADAAGFQVAAHAIGDEAVDAALDAFERCEAPGEMRHRVEHAELVTEENVERFADLGVVASMQPNFLKWAHEGGLYDARIGEERRKRADPLRNLADAGVSLAFSSDCMPLDPLLGVHEAVNAESERQRLDVTEALRAYTVGAAYAGFDEDRLGTVEVGKRADFTVLDDSPWEHPEEIDGIDVALTVVDGDIVYDGRE
ncbi:amidohydrolase [Halospeciosus flavus]|uniref:Amidohydrolase n=1 Tax=Halospeciosus flavus TaxID=3032283 RepID=A0ABD5Z8F8_9EURY|nr:amidohydrolase [Halospeciosus flavus]